MKALQRRGLAALRQALSRVRRTPVSSGGDLPYEMPGETPRDDLDSCDWLAPFTQDVRFAVSGPVPGPNPNWPPC